MHVREFGACLYKFTRLATILLKRDDVNSSVYSIEFNIIVRKYMQLCA